jgi:hypothetical protein
MKLSKKVLGKELRPFTLLVQLAQTASGGR